MFSWFKSLRERWAKRREERRATAAERAVKQNEGKALRNEYERHQHKDPMAPNL
jgi:hypothetical protein